MEKKEENDFFNEEIMCGHLVTTDVKRVWHRELLMLDFFMDICNKYNLSWYSSGGTLLGAIRHNGFIPWDDDVDLVMPRKDYDIFCKVALNELKYPYELKTYLTDEKCVGYGFAKIVDVTTTAVLTDFLPYGHNDFYANRYVWIDIFPLDYVYDEDYSNDAFFVKMDKEMNFLYKNGFYEDCLKINKEKQDIFSNRLPTDKLCTTISSFGSLFKNCIYNSEWFDSYLLVDFCNLKIRIPNGYDSILRTNYGDYTIPVKGGSLHNGIVFDLDTPFNEYKLRYKNDSIKFGVCLMTKDEEIYVDEFIEYYIGIGTNKIIIYNNGKNDKLPDIVKKYNNVILIDFSDDKTKDKQFNCYRDCWNKYAKEFDYFMFVDTDEYLSFNNFETVQDYLSYYDFYNYEAIYINWECYGDSGKTNYENIPIRKRFTEKARFKIEDNTIKSIYNMRRLRNTKFEKKDSFFGHRLKMLNKICDSNCNPIANVPKGPSIKKPQHNSATIKHYITKTINEFISSKIKRGDAVGNYERVSFDFFFKFNEMTDEKKKIAMDYVDEHNKNYINDNNYNLFICDNGKYNLNKVLGNYILLNDEHNYFLKFPYNNKVLAENNVPEVTNMQRSYSECSRMYWVWKKYDKLKKYVGFCHYRRFFCFYDDIPDFDGLFKRYDAIVTGERFLSNTFTIVKHFNCYHNIIFLDEWLSLINEMYPEYTKPEIELYKNKKVYCLRNMFILKKDDFDKYMEWCFSLSEEYNRRHNLKTQEDVTNFVKDTCNKNGIKYTDNMDRLHGYFFEICQGLYFKHNFKRILKMPIKMVE